MHAALITGPVLLMAGPVIKRHPLCRWTPFTVAGRTVSLSESRFRASDSATRVLWSLVVTIFRIFMAGWDFLLARLGIGASCPSHFRLELFCKRRRDSST
jgi:hypothetical protein